MNVASYISYKSFLQFQAGFAQRLMGVGWKGGRSFQIIGYFLKSWKRCKKNKWYFHNTYSCKNMRDIDYFSDTLVQDLLFKWTSMNMLYLKVKKETKNGIPAAASSSAFFSDVSETARNHWEIKPHTNPIHLSVLFQFSQYRTSFKLFLTTVIRSESEKWSVFV